MKLKLSIFILLTFFAVTFAQKHNHHNEDHHRHHCRYSDRLIKEVAAMYPGDANIDITYYKLDLTLTTSPEYLSGVVTVKAKSVSDNLGQFYLDLMNTMTVDSVTSPDNSVIFSHASNKISITLGTPLMTDDVITVDVHYRGRPGSSGLGSFAFNYEQSHPAIWTLSEPYGAADWFPSKNTPADKADSSDVWITAAETFVSVSNGKLIAEIDNGDGTKTYKWKNRYPIAQYLISLAMSNYQLYTNYYKYSETDSMAMTHYNYPANWNNGRKEDLDKTVPMMEVFAELFGEYPFINEKYGHAEFGWGGGMEHQTISSMGAYYESIVAHELAHQWFGDKITCADWQNIWLNEGFAVYLEALWDEAAHGWEAYQANIANEMGEPGQYWKAKGAVGSIYVQDITSVSQIFNGARTYAKAGVVLHMLRGVLGDSLFFKSIRAYIDDPELSYDVAVTEDLQEIVERESGHDLEYFFQEWIYGENYPKYSYDWNYEDLGNGESEIKVTISQSTNTNPTFFTMPIQLGITTADGDTVVTVFNDQKSQEFTFNVVGTPTKLELDPENWILKDINNATGVDSDSYGALKDFRVEQNFPNPFNPTTTINYYIPQQTKVVIKLYDVLGNEVKTLVNETKAPGKYSYNFDVNSEVNGMASGIYIYSVQAGDFREARKMTYLK